MPVRPGPRLPSTIRATSSTTGALGITHPFNESQPTQRTYRFQALAARHRYWTPNRFPTVPKASRALSTCAEVWAAESCTRILACPLATTGKKKPIT